MTESLRLLPFLLLFPGLFAYHWSALNGWSPLFLGGYVNEVSAAVCVGVQLAGLILPRNQFGGVERWTAVDRMFAIFMTWFAFVALVHAIHNTAPGTTRNHIASLNQMLACYVAIRRFPCERAGRSLLVLTGIFSASVMWAAQNDALGVLSAHSDNSHVAGYQQLARAFLMTAAFGLVQVQRRLLRLAGYLVAMVVLFFIGARSEVFGAIVLFAVFETAKSRRPLQIAPIVFAVTALLGYFILGSADTLSRVFPDNRFVYLLLERDQDNSVVARMMIQQLAWSTVLSHPFLGEYGHYEKVLNAGSYAHSWVSVWVDLGMIGLGLFLLAHIRTGIAVLSAYRSFVFRGNGVLKDFAGLGIGLFGMTVVFSIFAKTFTDVGFPIAAGLAAGLCERLFRTGSSLTADVPSENLGRSQQE